MTIAEAARVMMSQKLEGFFRRRFALSNTDKLRPNVIEIEKYEH